MSDPRLRPTIALLGLRVAWRGPDIDGGGDHGDFTSKAESAPAEEP